MTPDAFAALNSRRRAYNFTAGFTSSWKIHSNKVPLLLSPNHGSVMGK